MLREAYELGARASAELGDHADALHLSHLSLRLLQENPFLLVMTADIAAKQADLSLAERSARDALRHLANADTPSPWRRPTGHASATTFGQRRTSCWAASLPREMSTPRRGGRF